MTSCLRRKWPAIALECLACLACDRTLPLDTEEVSVDDDDDEDDVAGSDAVTVAVTGSGDATALLFRGEGLLN